MHVPGLAEILTRALWTRDVVKPVSERISTFHIQLSELRNTIWPLGRDFDEAKEFVPVLLIGSVGVGDRARA